MKEERLLTVREASEQLGLREATVRKWVLEKRIGYYKIGRAVRVPAEAVTRLIRESYRKPIGQGEPG